ncbi:hypothetical protein [Phenylobacterium sp.]|uniref:hypothetical protein n=1 Tax=Phenylobacterium sp. TaxID=1871053 RepID=UPI001207E94D|nr:hypothetical protein [Phenylobacterium sp.]THD61071.1 MAG: hypothetical protein E8A49_12460 [Phenylobacterium sp.]
MDDVSVTIGGHGAWEQFGTYISAVLSFFGVVAGLLWSGYLNRTADTQREHEKDLDLYHEIKILRIALLADLQNLQRVMAEEKKRARNKNEKSTWFPTINFFQIYECNLEKIGLLQQDEATALVNSYYAFNEQRSYILRFGNKNDRKAEKYNNVEILYIDDEEREKLVYHISAILNPARRAKLAISRGINMPPPAAPREGMFAYFRV